ncbi:PDZ domain-containing protein [Humisphaera borealis]|uniref:PDZ domain-containing protein n=1 Tax=Humisphaera borealis TaxID=2807512 RepID=A0A7M2X1M0_9BACT|nr:PDZ domain-containing protein [Humisphaera borealis]QOV91342.1 PDZ domain-containing protein [Humisphaera borealis]
MAIKGFHFAAFALLLFSRLAMAADVYVAPDGRDDAPGTKQLPLRTLSAAQRAIRTAVENGPRTVHIAGGTYYLAEPLVLTSADSGTEQSPIIWKGDEGQEVVLSGSKRFESLQWKPYKGEIVQAELPADAEVDALFVNGEQQVLSRYPNFDPNVTIYNGYSPQVLSRERVARWSDPAGGFMHAMHPGQWGGFHYRLVGKDDQGQIKMEGGWQGNRPAQPHATFRYVNNIFEELDAPHEWFFQPRTHVLYFYPPAGMDLAKARVEGARLRHLIEFRGSEGTPVKWVTFRGLTLRHTAPTFMETREPLLRGDWTVYRGGAVVFAGAEDCAIENSFLDQLGGNGVFLDGYNRRVAVRGCRIDGNGASGVLMVGRPDAVRSPLFRYEQRQVFEQMDHTPGPKSHNYPADCLVEECLITRIGRIEKQAAGVGIDIASRITVRHCSIYDVPRAGINIGDGCFGGHIIEHCDIFDTVKETGDHGSFNSWGRDRYWLPNRGEVDKLVAAHPGIHLWDAVEPVILRNNRWRCDHGWDIDLDDGTSNFHIYNNLCLAGGIKNREGYGRVVENNIMAGNTFHPHVWFNDSGDIFRRNIVFTAYKPIGMPKTWGKEIDFNLLHDPGRRDSAPATALQSTSNQDSHSITADAQFVDPAKGDFTVRDGSSALALGFKNFSMTDFGVTRPALKSLARTPSFGPTGQERSRRSAAVVTWLGATVRNIVGNGEVSAHGLNGEAGVLVLQVPSDSALAKAGLKKDDVILSVDGQKVGDAGQLSKLSGMLTKKPRYDVLVWRNQSETTLTVSGNEKE